MRFNTFNGSNPNRVAKYLSDGSAEYGQLLIGEDRIVRFFTLEEISEMEGVGTYSGASGYFEYVQTEAARSPGYPEFTSEGLRALPLTDDEKCPACNGRGDMKGRQHHGEMRNCKTCGGSGWLKAVAEDEDPSPNEPDE